MVCIVSKQLLPEPYLHKVQWCVQRYIRSIPPLGAITCMHAVISAFGWKLACSVHVHESSPNKIRSHVRVASPGSDVMRVSRRDTVRLFALAPACLSTGLRNCRTCASLHVCYEEESSTPLLTNTTQSVKPDHETCETHYASTIVTYLTLFSSLLSLTSLSRS